MSPFIDALSIINTIAQIIKDKMAVEKLRDCVMQMDQDARRNIKLIDKMNIRIKQLEAENAQLKNQIGNLHRDGFLDDGMSDSGKHHQSLSQCKD